jgi:hypothetical protein
MKSDYLEIWLNSRKRAVFFAASGAVSTALEKPRE